jgi:hypothetical protein
MLMKDPIFIKDKLAQTNTNLFIKAGQSLVLDGAAGSDVVTITYCGADNSTGTPAYDEAASPAVLTLRLAVPRWTAPADLFITVAKPTSTAVLGVLLVG